MEHEEMLEEQEIQEFQDEPLFVVETELNVDTQGEASRTVTGKKSAILGWVMIGLCGAAVAYIVVECILHNTWKQNAIGLALIIAMFAYSIYSRNAMPKKALKRWESNLIQRFGTPALHLTTEFYPLSLAQTMHEDDSFLGEGYSSITEMLESENLFLLRYRKQQYFFVSKKGFTKGTADEFRTFIQARIGGK